MTIPVLAAVVLREGRYLVCRRPAHKRHGGLWEFPGGKMEDGESDFDALERELAEELALMVVRVGAVIHSVRDPGSDFEIHFLLVDIAGQPQCLEHDEVRWASLADLIELPLAPSDRRFVQDRLIRNEANWRANSERSGS